MSGKYKPGYIDEDVEIVNGVVVPRGFDPKKEDKGLLGTEVPEAEQTEEMKQFAEEHDAVWVRYGKEAVCLPYAEWDESKHPRVPAGSEDGGQFGAGGVAIMDFIRGKGEVTTAQIISKFGDKAHTILNELIASGKIRGGLGGLRGRGATRRAMHWRIEE